MASVRTHVVDAVEWWVLVATVALTPLVFSRLTFDVYNITEVTVLWVGAVVAAAMRLVRAQARDFPRLPALWPVAALTWQSSPSPRSPPGHRWFRFSATTAASAG